MPSIDVDRLKHQGRQFFAGFTTAQKIATGIALVAVVAAAFLFTRVSHDQSYTPLFTNLDAADASQITDALTAKGVPYELADSGRTVTVPQNDVYQLRIDLSAQGLPGSGGGYALLDKEGITTSEFRQRVDYQRALQGELEKTIAAMDGVQATSVHLVVPPQSVFADTSQPASASVLLRVTPGHTLSSSHVQAIVHLVASSVDGLKPEQVTVADTSGAVLAAPGKQAGSADASAQETSSYEQGVSEQVRAMLDRVVGPGRAVVAVQATLNFDQTTKTNETYTNPNLAPNTPPNAATPPIPLEQKTTNETLQGDAATGALGTTGAAAGTPSNYQKTEGITKNAVNHSVENVESAPGQVTRQSVSVILDSEHVAADQLTNLYSTISAAAGIQSARGDVLQIARMPFDRSAARAAAGSMTSASDLQHQANLMSILRLGGAILIVLVVLFVLWRSTRRAAQHRVPRRLPVDLAQIEAMGAYTIPPPVEYELPAGTPAHVAVNSERSVLRTEVADLVDHQPEDVALTLRGWLSERR